MEPEAWNNLWTNLSRKWNDNCIYFHLYHTETSTILMNQLSIWVWCLSMCRRKLSTNEKRIVFANITGAIFPCENSAVSNYKYICIINIISKMKPGFINEVKIHLVILGKNIELSLLARSSNILCRRSLFKLISHYNNGYLYKS
jgi:hypothetical protein